MGNSKRAANYCAPMALALYRPSRHPMPKQSLEMYDEVCIAAACGLLPVTDWNVTMKEVKRRIKNGLIDSVTVEDIALSANEAQIGRMNLAENGVKTGKFR